MKRTLNLTFAVLLPFLAAASSTYLGYVTLEGFDFGDETGPDDVVLGDTTGAYWESPSCVRLPLTAAARRNRALRPYRTGRRPTDLDSSLSFTCCPNLDPPPRRLSARRITWISPSCLPPGHYGPELVYVRTIPWTIRRLTPPDPPDSWWDSDKAAPIACATSKAIDAPRPETALHRERKLAPRRL